MTLRLENVFADPENIEKARHLLPAAPITPEGVQRSLDHLREHSPDSEIAHALEDDLYTTVLASIADGTCTDPVECARIVLTSQDIEFARLCS